MAVMLFRFKKGDEWLVILWHKGECGRRVKLTIHLCDVISEGPLNIICRVALTLDEWTPESGLVTAAFKIRRREVVEKFRKEIDFMYKNWSRSVLPNLSNSTKFWTNFDGGQELLFLKKTRKSAKENPSRIWITDIRIADNYVSAIQLLD